MKKNQQKGATMIETLSVLSIIAVVAISLFSVIGKIYDRYKQSEVVDEIRTLQKNIKHRYAADYNFSELSQNDAQTKLIEEKVVPGYMVLDNQVVHAYGSTVDFEGTENNYSITFNNVSKQGCVELLMQDWVVSDMSDLIQIKVAGKTYTWKGATKLPITISDAFELCKDDEEENDIEWTFQ